PHSPANPPGATGTGPNDERLPLPVYHQPPPKKNRSSPVTVSRSSEQGGVRPKVSGSTGDSPDWPPNYQAPYNSRRLPMFGLTRKVRSFQNKPGRDAAYKLQFEELETRELMAVCSAGAIGVTAPADTDTAALPGGVAVATTAAYTDTTVLGSGAVGGISSG